MDTSSSILKKEKRMERKFAVRINGIPLHKWYLYNEEGMQHVCPECGHVATVSQSELELCQALQPRGVNMFSRLYAKVAPRIQCVKCGFRNPYWMFCIRKYSKELTIADVVKNSIPKKIFDDRSIILDSMPNVPRENWVWNNLVKDFEGDTLDVIYLTPNRGQSRMWRALTKPYTNFGG